MTLWADDNDDVTFEVVCNDEGQHSVWPTTQALPAGWCRTGSSGTRDECLDEVERRWTDLRPRSVRAAVAATVDDGSGPALPIHLLVERAPGLAGSDVAMRCGEVTLSRAELFQTSRAWAGVLAGAGCGPEVPVAILVPRSVDALVAIFAVLHAGSAYVPLSPAESVDRLLAVLDDCGRPLVLAEDDAASRLSAYRGRVMTLAELRSRAHAGASQLATPANVSTDNLAFVVYTSGTTGEPKGVEGIHRQLTNYARWCARAFPHRPGEWTVLHAPLSFLGSMTNIFTPLLAGWPIEIASEGATVDDLLELTGRVPVGLLKLTPTHVRMMLARGAADRGVARQLMIGSEPLVMTDELAAWIGGDRSVTFVNHYGLTETHGCFCHWFGTDVPVGSGVPIGKPIANVRAHLVDAHGDDVPAGEVGELLVAGHSIGRGYRRSPRLTADRWIPDRHGPPGARILRTGDLGRLRPDGTVELVGRADRQVKVRGYRVEPGAVEHILRTRHDVLEATVLPRRQDGATTLVAYLVPRGHAELDPAAIHRALSEQLPAPFVPSRIAVLAELPTNANGKLDVSALPDPLPIQPSNDGAPSMERWTRHDLVVADAFSASLGIDAVGLHDHFFELGGDSLAAVQVALIVGERLGAEVPVPTPDCGTVRAYAQMVATTAGEVRVG